MLIVPLDASDEVILDLVRGWMDALAAGEYVGAMAMLTEIGNEREWPPDLVDKVIAGYQSAEDTTPSRVTSPRTAMQHLPGHPQAEVTRWPRPRARPEVVGTVEYDLPINGRWSDLTAIFWLRRLPEGLALELYDIHIL